MNKTLTLAKILLKNGSDQGPVQSKRKKLRRSAFFLIIALVAFLPLIISIGSMVSAALDGLKGINQQGVIISLALPVAVIIIFFFGIMYIINTFYFSRDIENLLPLPLKPEHILGAKFITVLVYEYITEAVILLPVTAVYGVKNGEGFLFYLYSVIVFLFIPVIPLVAAAAIDMVIMRFTSFAKNKDLFRIASGTLAMFIALGVNLYIQRFTSQANNPENIAALLKQGNNSLLGTMSSLFPSTKTAVYAIVNSSAGSGLYSILSFLGITVMSYIVFMVMGKALYFKGVIGVSETASKRRNLDLREFGRQTRQSPVVYSYMVKELKLLYRSPVYFLNCILMNFLWPVFLILPFIAQPKASEGLSAIMPYIQGKSAEPLVMAAAFAAGIFITASNMITSTSISREGKNIFFMKYIPVDYEKQLMGKVFSGTFMGLIGMAAVVPAAMLIFKLRAEITILCLAASIPGILFSALAGIIVDVSMPKLNWDTEQKAVKQNLNGIISLFGSIVLGALIIVLVQYAHPGLTASAIALALIFGIIDFTLYKIVKGYCINKLKGMDV